MTTKLVAGIDVGGTAVNYTFLDARGRFLLEGLCEYPARSAEGPDVCFQQIGDGLAAALAKVGAKLDDVAAVGLGTPGPASAGGVLSRRGSTNFVHPEWAGLDLRATLERKIGKPVVYINDANAAALWGHYSVFGGDDEGTSVSAIIGTGLGGGVVTTGGRLIVGKNGFGGELGHVLVPYQSIREIRGAEPRCNCGRIGDLESLCSLTAIQNTLLPFFLARYPGHELARAESHTAAKLVRSFAENGDPMCREIFRVQTRALGLFFDQMINVFDPHALLIGGGAIETTPELQNWFVEQVRAGMPAQREEQADTPMRIISHGDTAGARGAALAAVNFAKAG